MRVSFQEGFDIIWKHIESLSELALKTHKLSFSLQDQVNAHTRRMDDLQRQINDLVMERNDAERNRRDYIRNNTPG